MKTEKETVERYHESHLTGDRRRLIGRAQILLAATSFGTMSIFAKIAFAAGLNSSHLLALRFALASAVLWAYFLIFKRHAIRIGYRELMICAALGIAGYGIFSNLAFASFQRMPASVAVMLFFSYPALVMVLDWLISRRRIEGQMWLGGLLILSGVAFGVSTSFHAGINTGAWLALGGAAWYAVYLVTSRRLLQALPSQTVTLYVATFAAVGFWVIGRPSLAMLSQLPAKAWIMTGAIVLFSTVLALLALFAGLEKLTSGEAAQLATFELIVCLALSALVLAEPVTLPMMLGAGLILMGIITGQTGGSLRLFRRNRSISVGAES